MNKSRVFTLTVALLMMCAAAISTRGMLFGHNFAPVETQTIPSDTLTITPRGTEIIHTAPLCSKTGYAGSTPLDIEIDHQGRVLSITPLPNAETPGFMRRAESLLANFIGQPLDQAGSISVDAVSGATYTSEALKANVQAASQYYRLTGYDKHSAPVPWRIWVALAVTLAACIVPLVVKNRIYRIVQLVANVAVLGFWCHQFLDYHILLHSLATGIAWPSAIVVICMLVAAFVYPLIGKPQHYCNHICPLGSAQILVAEMCGYKLHISAKTLQALGWVRRIIWGATMLLLWADVATQWLDWELFAAFMPQSTPVAVTVLAAVAVGLSAIVSRPYCRFVCPTGSLIKFAENQ